MRRGRKVLDQLGGRDGLTLNTLRQVVDDGICLLADRAVRVGLADQARWDSRREAVKRAALVEALRSYEVLDAGEMRRASELVASRNYESARAAIEVMLLAQAALFKGTDTVTWNIVASRLQRLPPLVVEQLVADQSMELMDRFVRGIELPQNKALPVVDAGMSDTLPIFEAAIMGVKASEPIDHDRRVVEAEEAILAAKRALRRAKRHRLEAKQREAGAGKGGAGKAAMARKPRKPKVSVDPGAGPLGL